MANKKRLATIEKELRPSEKVVTMIKRGSLNCERWETNGIPEEDRSSANISKLIVLKIIGPSDHEDDIAVINSILNSKEDSVDSLNRLLSNELLQKKPVCVEVRDPVESPLLVCSKKDWRAIKEREQCLDCDSRRIIYRLYKTGEKERVLASYKG